MEQVNRLGGRRKDNTMTLGKIDESPKTKEGENWHCPDCQSWGPFTVTMLTRVRLHDEGTPFLDDEGDTDDDSAFACVQTASDRPPWPRFAMQE